MRGFSMRAYEFLTRPRMAKIRLQKAQAHVASLKSVAERATASFGLNSEPVSHTRNPSAMQDMIIQLAEAEEEEKRLQEELAEIELKVGLVLANLQDKDLYDFMTYHFLDCVPVRSAAYKVGYSYSWGRQAQARGICEVQAILDRGEYSGGDTAPA